MNKKLLVGGLSLAVIGISSLAFISKPTYQEVNINNLNTEKVALYVKNETGNYEKTNTIPTKGYVLNEEKSRCNNNAKPSWNKTTNSLKIKDLSNDNTSCYLYFDALTGIDAVIANAKTESPDFSKIATTDEGVYAVEDGMYSGTSYYWRGAVENNYVKFAGFCWRIIRINGDGSIRLIYDGTTCHANGTTTAESIAVGSQAYNASSNRSEYVGYTYTEESQRPSGAGTASNAKTQLESWYSANITGVNATKIAEGKFCNDRNISEAPSSWESGYAATWSATGTQFAYAGPKRLYEIYAPTLSCPSGDVYTLKVGLITADEVSFAGGRQVSNTSYYLYNGQNYWTMSPYQWKNGYAYVFYVYTSGAFINGNWAVGSTFGLRPVISLKADTLFKEGTEGTLDNPYVVEGA